MKKLVSILLVCGLMVSVSARAQSVVWGFDDDNNEIYVPIQCDGQFDEENGGVFVPSPEELYNQGELFLASGDKVQQSSAGYCFMSAAIQGNVDAQYRLAQLYEKGIGMPQNDLTAYKWAYMASLAGHQEAGQLALVLEQYLTAEDIELATKDVQSVLPQIQTVISGQIQEADVTLEQKKEALEKVNQEIDVLLGIPPQRVYTKKAAVSAGGHAPKVSNANRGGGQQNARVQAAPAAKRGGGRPKVMFEEMDRMK